MPREVSYERSIQWSMWANETALLGAWLVFIGSIVGIIGGATDQMGQFLYWIPVGIYGMIIGILMIIFEYPRGKKTKGNTVTREHQEIFSGIVEKLGKFSKNFYMRAAILFIVCIPAGMIVPTFFGAFCLLLASIIYSVAASKQEKWIPVTAVTRSTPKENESVSAPPNKPPPRLPQDYKSFSDIQP